MFLSDLQTKDIISIKDGRRIGKIIDAEINSEGHLEYLIIEERKNFKKIMSSGTDTKISFSKITKIGEDVILVDMWYNEMRGVTSEQKDFINSNYFISYRPNN